ncbi:hypothetical protein RHGRI_028887 [Rhododendron griersonianum]|uniref:Pro-apoptotic serine protease NMA111 n=1 Tax=Rhododendron griersonianum TaxID=479676 RepID=A0AAV6IHI7_9ERIC|nr:hypothetical protein RHGRI_028887 [Rhododendron griersonianum]
MAGEEEPCVEMGPEEFKESTGVTAEDWRNALSKVVPAVVVIHTTSCRAFDTYSAGSGYATGFVVDKKRGIILTNRHVVKPGPVVAEAMFLNREEIPVYPMYRDPVHDFGFFRYDPGLIHFLSYEEIPLSPEAACVGLEIRVVGNDSGEKVSILAGTLARLDRDAPRYDKDGYNDFNTFYIQAASGTKGGSSGSPVIDSQGRAVALNAGSKPSRSSAFYLPLERVVRALKLLQKGRDSSTDGLGAVYIPRGTLQVTLLHKGFDETHRLGLRIETEQIVRDASRPGETGMLVVDSAVPGGPAQHLLQPGDVLVRVNGKVITQFLEMETLLDDSVDHKIELQIERGGTPFTVDLPVQDLHSITPDSFLEVSGAVMHPLSYQQARNFRFHCGLVYVAEPGYLLGAKVPRHSIIKRFGGEEISRLEDLISVLSKLTRGAQVPLEYISYKDRHRTKSVLVTTDRHEWYGPPLVYTRNDSTGLWTRKPALPPESPLLSSGMISVEQGLENCRAPPGAGEASLIERMCQKFNRVSADGVTSVESSFECVAELQNFHDDSDVGATKNQIEEDSSGDSIVMANFSLDEPRVEKPEDSTSSENVFSGDYQGSAAVATNVSVAERVIEPTLVMVEVHVPPSCTLDGVHSLHSLGTGVIVYHSPDMGLVVVDKTTVVISASDVMLSFAAFPIEIPGEVVFLHPVHNYALVAYDPSALGADGASVVRAAKLLPEPPLCRGDAVYLVGLSRSLQATSRKSIVTNAHAAINIGPSDSPRYRATNIEVIELDADFGSTFSGVLSDEHGRVQAIWGSFSGQILDEIISGANGPNLLINGVRRQMPPIRILEVELYPRLLSKARSFGLSNNWVQTLVKKDPIRRQVLCVKGCLAGSKAENALQPGDMILAINKEPITCFGDIEDGCRVLNQCDESDGKLGMTIFRRGCEIEMLVGTDVRDGNGTKRVISWCGCIVQDPHPAVRALGFLPDEGHGVYVARLSSGSPAHRYGLYDRQWIVEVNGKRTPDLDAFVEVTKEIDDGEFARVKTVKLTGKPQVLTLKQDLHYWPTWEVRRNPYTAMASKGDSRAINPSVNAMAEEKAWVEIGAEFKEGGGGSTAEDWRNALGKVVPAVVVIRTTTCRAFDTESAGPVVAEAMFLNREEIPVYPVYRDPVHDFGFFRYDPGSIQFLSYEEIPLAPEAASVGLEIRVVGNDSGEKVSILAGTLARLDRDAPYYKKNGYNDFNTFYIQAASGTKGGSSGSPVVDSLGRAVALNAGSKTSSSSAFFLPLERVVRALKLLRKGIDSCTDGWGAVYIPRGTLQLYDLNLKPNCSPSTTSDNSRKEKVTLLHKGFEETRRLGLRIETEQMVRHASRQGETGMLVVDSAVPGGPAHHLLQPGDVLVRVNGDVITQFLKMETLLDDSVDRKIELQIERGGTPFTVDLTVQDLHSITPDSFLEVSGAVIHPLSYQQARNFRFRCGLVYVAEPGYLLRAKVPRLSIIKKFGGEEISRLEDLVSVLSKLTRGARVPLEYISYKDRHRSKSVLVTIDRHEWYGPPLIYTRDDSTGLWTGKPALPPDSLLLSSGMISVEQGLENDRVPPDAGEASPIEHMCQNFNQESADGVTSVESSFEGVAELQNSRDNSDVGATKDQIEEDSSADSPTEEKMEDLTSSENAFLGDYQGSAAVATNASVAERVIEPALVMLEVHIPPSCMHDGVHSQHSSGTGVIVYHSSDLGLIVVDKATVVISASDVMLSFAAFPIEIPGEVVFLHPVHNYALVAYDPSALGAASVVRAAKLLPSPSKTTTTPQSYTHSMSPLVGSQAPPPVVEQRVAEISYSVLGKKFNDFDHGVLKLESLNYG